MKIRPLTVNGHLAMRAGLVTCGARRSGESSNYALTAGHGGCEQHHFFELSCYPGSPACASGIECQSDVSNCGLLDLEEICVLGDAFELSELSGTGGVTHSTHFFRS